MRVAMALALLLSAGTAPALAGDAKPRILAAEAHPGSEQSVTLKVSARDRDGIVRGIDIDWGDGAAQGMSRCEIPMRRDAGRTERFRLGYAYAAPGDYQITVKVNSGGCGKRRQQHSAPRTVAVRIG